MAGCPQRSWFRFRHAPLVGVAEVAFAFNGSLFAPGNHSLAVDTPAPRRSAASASSSDAAAFAVVVNSMSIATSAGRCGGAMPGPPRAALCVDTCPLAVGGRYQCTDQHVQHESMPPKAGGVPPSMMDLKTMRTAVMKEYLSGKTECVPECIP